VRHDTITVPAGTSTAEVQALAERKAQSQAGRGETISFVHFHGSRPVAGSEGAEVEWRFSFHITYSGDTAAES
jgi:hypothetical protein